MASSMDTSQYPIPTIHRLRAAIDAHISTVEQGLQKYSQVQINRAGQSPGAMAELLRELKRRGFSVVRNDTGLRVSRKNNG